MVILKYLKSNADQSSVIAGVCVKPSMEAIKSKISEVLGKAYQPDIVNRYVNLLGEVIYNSIAFPDNGIYQINDSNELIRLENQNWNSTGLKVSDYVINSDSKFWKTFENEFGFLMHLIEPIQTTVKSMTEQMFSVDKWVKVASVELQGELVSEDFFKWLLNILTKAFTQKVAQEVATNIQEILFGGTQGGIQILKDDAVKYIAYKNYVTEFKMNSFEAVRNVLEKYLMSEDARIIETMLKNQLLYGLATTAKIIQTSNDKIKIKDNKFDIMRTMITSKTGERTYCYELKLTGDMLSKILWDTQKQILDAYRIEEYKGRTCYWRINEKEKYNREYRINIEGLDLFYVPVQVTTGGAALKTMEGDKLLFKWVGHIVHYEDGNVGEYYTIDYSGYELDTGEYMFYDKCIGKYGLIKKIAD